MGFVVQPGTLTILPEISVSPQDGSSLRPGSASVTHLDETLTPLTDLAVQRQLVVSPGSWISVTVDCKPVLRKPFHQWGLLEPCAPA